jgi:hypothetical protein
MTKEGDPASPPESWGHQIDVGNFLREIVHLMCCVDTGPSLRNIWRRERSDRDRDEQLLKFTSIAYAHLRTEVPRLLIATAATLRAKIDDGSWATNDERVGWLSQGENLDPEKGEALSIREACNKIIHAKAVRPHVVTENDGVETIGSLMLLNGERGGRSWTAEINLREFCIAVANTNFYPHGSEACRH